MTGSLTERYDDRIAGVLSCYDRVVVTGTLPTVCYAAGMTKFLYAIGVRIFDYPQFASTLRDRVRERDNAASSSASIIPWMNSRTRPRRLASIGSNQSSSRRTAVSACDCRVGEFVLLLVMAWSPPALERG